ncbi:MAG: dual specificity protein phosphatase family protein [Caldilineaceae bacterium]
MNTIFWLDGPWPGRLAIVARPRGNEWLADEVRHWGHNGIDVVISLLTPPEKSELGLNQEALLAAEAGIQLLAFPILDRGVPSSLGEVSHFVEEVSALLQQGKNVAIHCRQGIGRSGLLAASLLVSAGIDPDHAFERIEDARGAPVPDTPVQRQWVEKFARITAMPAW